MKSIKLLDDFNDYKSPWIEESESTISFLNKLFINNIRKYKKEDYIFHQDEEINNIYIIKSGRVRYSVYSHDGNETHRIIGKPGCFFGDVSYFDGNPENGNLSCIVDCEVFEVPKDDVKELLFKDLDFSKYMIQSICRKYRTFEHLIYEYTSESAYSRVLTQLINLANAHGIIIDDKIKIDIIFTHEDLSYITFLSRVSVSYIMRDLTKKGLIEKDKGYVYINDFEALKKWSEETKTS